MTCNDWSIIMVHDKLLVNKLSMLYINKLMTQLYLKLNLNLERSLQKKYFVKCECWLSLHACTHREYPMHKWIWLQYFAFDGGSFI